MINTAVVMGRLVADPELRTTTSGVSTCRFTIAVDRQYQKQGEEKKTDFISILAWRNTAEFIEKFFHKGSLIAIEGSIQTGSYNDKDGNKRYTFDIVANNVSFCGSKNDNKPVNNTPAQHDYDAIGEEDEDLPF